MSLRCIPGCALIASLLGLGLPATAAVPADTQQRLANAHVPFVANEGQLGRPDVRFYARTFGGTVFVHDDGRLVYALPAPGLHRGWAFSEHVQSTRSPAPAGQERAGTRVSQFKGRDPSRWRHDLPTFQGVDLGELYPGISADLLARGGHIEKRFHVAPGADPARIRIAVDGVDHLSVDDAGQLVLHTALGAVRFTRPQAFQDIDGRSQPVPVAYRVAGATYGFDVGAYDRARPLLIDPLLASTFLGGRNDAYELGPTDDAVRSMLLANGSVYVAGRTTSTDFPTQLGAFDLYQGGIQDGFVTRLSLDLSQVEASTYLGGASQDFVAAIAAGPDGSVYATGYTNGSDFPTTPGAYTGTNGVSGPFIARLSADLGTLQAAAVMGTGSDTSTSAIAYGGGAVYIAGQANSTRLPTTPDAYDTTCGTDGKCNPSGAFGVTSPDAFVSKLDANLTQLLASTYLGGSSTEGAAGIAVEAGGAVLVVGQTQSLSFPLTPGSLKDNIGDLNRPVGYVSRLSSDLRDLLQSTALGGGDGLSALSAVIARADGVLVGGTTYASDFPVPPWAHDPSCGSDGQCDPFGPVGVPRSDGFVLHLTPALDAVLGGTYVGGGLADEVLALDVDATGRVTAVGRTASADFPTLGAQAWDASANGGDDAFIVRYDTALRTLLAGTYLGSSLADAAMATSSDAAGQVYVAGVTASPAFPTTAGAFDRSYNGGAGDAFVSLLDADLGAGGDNLPPVAYAGDDQTVSTRRLVRLDGGGSGDPDGQIVAYRWRQTAGPTRRLFGADTASAVFLSPRPPAGGTLVLDFELRVTDDDGATASDTVRITVGR